MKKIISASRKTAKTAGALTRKKAATPTTALAVLRAARKLLTPRSAWTQGCHARDEDGVFIGFDERGTFERAPVCWCPDGALMQVARSYKSRGYTWARRALQLTTNTGDGVWGFNDAPRRTHRQVLAWFDRAIKRAELES